MAAKLHVRRNVRPLNARRFEGERRSQANSAVHGMPTRDGPIQYGCCNVKIGCQNGNKGTSTNHSSDEVRMAQGTAATASHGASRGSPPSENSEEDQRPGEVGPLVKCDADRDGADRWFRGQRPVACRDGGDRHPVHKRIAADSGGRQLADDRGKCAANEPEIGGRDPSPGGPGAVGRTVPRFQWKSAS
jgi:hypothetical protein